MSTPITIDNALKILPFLIYLAQKGETRSYSDVFEKTGVHYRGALPNALGHIRDEITDPRKLPRLNVVAVNGQTHMPGDSFLPEGTAGLSKKEKRKKFEKCLKEVFLYKKWDDLLTEFNLKPLKKSLEDFIDIANKYNGMRGKGGEGKRHRSLKEYIMKHPGVLGLNKYKGDMEHDFPSGDRCDVVFTNGKDGYAVVEIKTGDKPIGDLVSGVYQAIKYRALLQAVKGLGKKIPVKAFLVAYEMPAEIIVHAKKHGVITKVVQERNL